MGNLKTFTTSVKKPFEAVRCHFEPQQDLHGYDKPWPAGGGKNLFNWDRTIGTPNPSSGEASVSPRVMDTEHYYVGLTRNNYYYPSQITQYSVSNGTISLTITAGGYGIGFPVKIDPSTVYVASYTNISNAKISVGLYDADWNFITHIDNITYFTAPSNAQYAALIVTAINTGACSLSNVQFEKGSTATSFAPYENLCPITGYDSVTVRHSGKNLCDVNAWEIDSSIASLFYADGQKLIVSNTAYQERYNQYVFPEKKQYTLSLKIKTTRIGNAGAFVWVDARFGSPASWWSQSILTYNLTAVGHEEYFTCVVPSNAYGIAIGHWGYTGTVEISEIQLEAGTTVTPYEPFGESATVEFPVCGVNQWDEEWEVGRYDYNTGIKYPSNDNIRCKNPIPVKASTSYYFTSSNTSALPRLTYYDADMNWIGYNTMSVAKGAFTTPENCAYVTFYMSTSYGTAYNNDIGINYTSAITSYEPHSNVAYGGEVEVINGDMKCKRLAVDMSALDWQYRTGDGNPYFMSYSYGRKVGLQGLMCEQYPIHTATGTGSLPDKTLGASAVDTRLYLRDSSFSTVEDLTAYLAGKKIVFLIDEPISRDVESASFTSYRGLNNVWHNLNGDIEVDYVAKDGVPPIEYHRRAIMASPHVAEQSGDVVSFDTDVKGKLKGAEVTLVPEQDLNGYDHPWPAGGGKNILDMSDENIILGKYINNGGVVSSNVNNFYNSAYVPVSSSTAYTLSMSQDVGYCSIMEYDSTKTFIKRTLFGSSSTPKISSATITTDSDTAYVLIGSNLNGATVDLADVQAINWQFEKGSSATSWTPYVNICPITGHTSAKVYDDPKYGGEIEWNQIVNPSTWTTTDYSNNGVSFKRNADGTVKVSGTVSGYTNGYVSLQGNTGITVGHKYFATTGLANSVSKIWYNGGGGFEVKEGIVQITALATGLYIIVRGEGTSVDETVKPMLFDLTQMFGAGNEPSTVAEFQSLFPATYYAYNTGEKTTVSAVNGDPCWEAEVELPVTGKNLMDFIGRNQNGVVGTNVNGVAHIVGTATAASYPIDGVAITLPAGTYKWSCSNVPSGVSMQWSKDGAWAGWVTDRASFTLTAATSVGMYIRVENGTTVDNDIWFQLEAGSTSTTFAPYSDETYGCTVNMVTGDALLKYIMVDMGYVGWSTGFEGFYAQNRDTLTKEYAHEYTPNLWSEIYKTEKYGQRTDVCISSVYGGSGYVYNGRICVKDTRYTAAQLDDFIQSVKGYKLVYEPKEPIAFTLTPQRLSALRGQNNIFSPDGQTTVRYWTHRKD